MQISTNEFPSFKKSPLFVSGLMLYWGEGDSKLENSQLRLSNANPKLIRIFALFVKSFLRFPENKIKGTMFIYPDLNEELCKKHRQEELNCLNNLKEQQHRSWAWNATYHRKCLKEALRQVEYHTAKLNVAETKVMTYGKT